MEGQTFLRDGVMMVRVPDGREFRVSDVMRLNNPGMEYDDMTGEAMAMTPPRDGGGSSKPREYSFGDVGSETLARTIDDVSSTAGGGGEITRSLLPEDWQQTFPDAMLAAGDYGLAGLLGLLGAAETGAGYAGDVVEGAQGLLGIGSRYRPGGSARGFQRMLMGMAEGAGYAPEGRMIALLTQAGAPRAAARAVVDRLNQPGQMPTTYSNPIPGLLGDAAENTGPKLRLYQGSPHDFAAERLVRMPDGSTQYIVGRPDVLPDVPTGAEVLRDFPLGRARMDKIGTGEGAQAYGHGLYFTETPDIGRSYRDMGGDFDAGMTIGGKDIQDYYTGLENQAARMPAKSASAIYDQMALLEDLMGGGDILHVRQQAANGAYSPEAVAWFERNVASKFKNKRSLFEVNVNANPEDFLDWDAPLSAQPNVLSRLGYSTMDEDAAHAEAIRIFEENPNGAWMNDPALKARINELNDMLDRLPPSGTGQDLYRGGASDDVSGILSQMGYGDPAAQSQALRDAGIPGIRYLDAGSRGAGAGSRNYVVFDENLISIVRKYGIAGAAAMLGVSALDVEQAMAQGQQRPQGLLSMGAQ